MQCKFAICWSRKASPLQTRNAELERQAGAGGKEAGLAAALLKTSASLFGRETLSDVVVLVEGQRIPAHRFVLASRGTWGSVPLADATEIALDLRGATARLALKWLYTEQLDDTVDTPALLEVLRAANTLNLPELGQRFVALHAGVRQTLAAWSRV